MIKIIEGNIADAQTDYIIHLQYKNLWLGINTKEITEEKIIKLLIYGDVE